MNVKILVAAIVVAAVACAGIYIGTSDHDGADLNVYASDGVHVSVSGNLLGQTVITIDTDDGTEFDGLYGSGWRMLSDDTKYTARMNDGDTVYAFSKEYHVVSKGEAFDVRDLLDTTTSGTVSVSTSDFDLGTADVDGTEITCDSFGVYRIAYTSEEGMTCLSVLSDGMHTVDFKWNLGGSSGPSSIAEKLKRLMNGEDVDYAFRLSLDILYSDYRFYTEAASDDGDERICHALNYGFDEKENIDHDAAYVDYGNREDSYISAIAEYIGSKTIGRSDQYIANVILAFTQNIPYAYDIEVHGVDEYWQYPLETLFLYGGDCEDTSILFCAIAEKMGYDTCIFVFNDHAAPGICLSGFDYPSSNSNKIDTSKTGWDVVVGTDQNGNKLVNRYYYGETTADNWLIGQVPADVSGNYRGAIVISSSESFSPDVTGDDLRLTFSVSGKLLQSSIFGMTYTTEFSGRKVITYVYHNESRDAYYMRQDYTYNYSGRSPESDTVYYWTDEDDPDGYTETHLGESDITSSFGNIKCNVWKLSYNSQYGYSVSETQYIGTEDNIPYIIDIEYRNGDSVFRTERMELISTEMVDADPGSYSLTVYTDPNTSETHGEASAFGDFVTLTASVADGHEFLGWFGTDGELLSSDASFDIGVDGDIIAYARSDNAVTVLEDESVDLCQILKVDGSGTLSVTDSDYAPVTSGEVTLDGTTATFTEAGNIYYVFYEDGALGIRTHCIITVDRIDTVRYEWDYDGTHYALDLDISYNDYIHYNGLYTENRGRVSHVINSGSDSTSNREHDLSFVHYDDIQTPYIKEIADYISSMTAGKSEQYIASVILAFCQSDLGATTGIAYTYDKDTHSTNEYWQFPLETLYLRTGDCEDTSILFSAIITYMGYDACLFFFTDHMAAGVALDSFTPSGNVSASLAAGTNSVDVDGTDYYYCETTNRDWDIGDVWSDEYPKKYITGLTLPDY